MCRAARPTPRTADARFDLDFDGRAISKLVVDGMRATFTRNGGELVVVPLRKIQSGHPITIEAPYSATTRSTAVTLGMPQLAPQRSAAVRTWDAQFTGRLSTGRY